MNIYFKRERDKERGSKSIKLPGPVNTGSLVYIE